MALVQNQIIDGNCSVQRAHQKNFLPNPFEVLSSICNKTKTAGKEDVANDTQKFLGICVLNFRNNE